MSSTSVLFVCLGNICRSPLAEGLFIHLADRRGLLDRFRVDSAGTGGWHAGEKADPRSRAVAAKHGIELPSRARKIEPRSDRQFDLVIAMDAQNHRDLLELGFDDGRVRLMREWDEHAPGDDVPDPYYGGDDGFDRVYEMLLRSCEMLLNELTADP